MKILFYIFIFVNNYLFSQDSGFLCSKNYVYNYFTQQKDSCYTGVGNLEIIPLKMLDFFSGNEYKYDSTNIELKITFKDKLIFFYIIEKGFVNGKGLCYYLDSNKIAIEGEFRNSVLHGLVKIFDMSGNVIEIMKFKKGKYVKTIFEKGYKSRRELRKRSRNRSTNPLLGNEIILRYQYENQKKKQ